MASREFTDTKGVVWRVWDVRPTHLHPATRGEDYMENFADGWLAFDSATGKRRLPAPYPVRWPEYDLRALEALCRAAKPVVARRMSTPSGEQAAYTERTAEQAARADAERTFMSPRGREWRVRLHECHKAGGGVTTVLRFTAGDIVVDLEEWPPDWKMLSREQFALMLLDAEPPRRLGKGERPQRRREDRDE